MRIKRYSVLNFNIFLFFIIFLFFDIWGFNISGFGIKILAQENHAYNDAYNIIQEVKIDNKKYYIGDIVKLYIYSKQKPKKIYSLSKNIIIKEYKIIDKKKLFLITLKIQCFNLGKINLNPVKIDYGYNKTDLGNANIEISSYMDDYNKNFKFPSQLKISIITFFNIIFILIIIFIIITLQIIFNKHFYEILQIFKIKNSSFYGIIKKIYSIQKNEKLSIKEKSYFLSKIINKNNIKLDYTSVVLLDKIKYELSEKQINENLSYYNDFFIKTSNKLINILKEKEIKNKQTMKKNK